MSSTYGNIPRYWVRQEEAWWQGGGVGEVPGQADHDGPGDGDGARHHQSFSDRRVSARRAV